MCCDLVKVKNDSTKFCEVLTSCTFNSDEIRWIAIIARAGLPTTLKTEVAFVRVISAGETDEQPWAQLSRCQGSEGKGAFWLVRYSLWQKLGSFGYTKAKLFSIGLSLGWWTSLSFRAQTKPEPRPDCFFSGVNPNFPKNILVSSTWESQGIDCVLPTRETARNNRVECNTFQIWVNLKPCHIKNTWTWL